MPDFNVAEVTDELIAEYADRLSADEVREQIAAALSHPASRTWRDKRVALKQWIERSAQWAREVQR